MRISAIRRESGGGRTRVAADVVWEESGRPDRTVFFETEEGFGDALAVRADAFVTGCIVPAWRHGERRVRVEGTVCPELREGLAGALSILASWRGESPPEIAVEPTGGFQPPPRREPGRTAALFSGGVDSLYTIRMNLLGIPRDHPAAIRDGILILGHDFGLSDSTDLEFEQFERRRTRLSSLARSVGIDLVPMRFNLRDLDEDLDLYIHDFFGAALAAAGHALTTRISALSIPSSYDFRRLIPCGSHPLLDPNFASAALSIRHDGAGRSRFQKLAVVADWPEGLARLQTCNRRPPPRDRVNCGSCEKCLRTAVGLLALGRLGGAGTFRESDVSADAVCALEWTEGFEEYWSELPAPLRRAGRADLAAVIETKLDDARRFREWRDEEDFKGLVKRFDRRYLGGAIASLAKRARRGAP